MRARTFISIALVVAGIFGCGVFAGWMLRPAVTPTRASDLEPAVVGYGRTPTAERTLGNLTSRLGLTPEQQAELAPVIGDWETAARAIEADMRAKRFELFKEYVEHIRPVLTPEQQKRFDEIVAVTRRRHERRGREVAP